MENIVYTSIGPVLHLNKAGELAQKRMKAAKLCDGLYITEPDKSGYTQFICELNGVVWLDCKAAESRIADGIKLMPGYFDKIKAGAFDGENIHAFKREISRRINRPDAPAIMELKKPERKKPCQSPDGTIRAKVLQYKPDGNTIVEKRETLTKYAEGIYYTLTPDNYGNEHCSIILEIDNVFWKYCTMPDNIFCPEHYRHDECVHELRTIVARFPDIVRKNAQCGQYIKKLQIEVMRRLGHDVADLQAAREEYIRQREECERQKAEEAAHKERERQEAEERRKAEALADGKEKLLNGEYISVEQIELIAKAVGYKINIRTLGFMREKVSEAVLCKNDTVHVWGRKLTSRNIDGTANVMRELYALLKAQAEEEAERAATPSETPQITTETAKTANVSTEEAKTAETANYSIPVEEYENAPQSPETPQTVKHTTRAAKLRETARKQPNSAIRHVRTTHARQKLGAQGYSMLADASATLAAINAPPIRGDCAFIGRAMNNPYW